jgi:hypothetical protein
MSKVLNFASFFKESSSPNNYDEEFLINFYNSSMKDWYRNESTGKIETLDPWGFYFSMRGDFDKLSQEEKNKIRNVESIEEFNLGNFKNFIYKGIRFSTLSATMSNIELGLKTLKGFPEETGLLVIGNTKIKNLGGITQKINGNLSLDQNSFLESLVGCPGEIGGKFSVKESPLFKTLEGGPKVIKGNSLSISMCGLDTLKGAPEIIENSSIEDDEAGICYVNFESNNLTSLIGFPSIGGEIKKVEINCKDNKLISLFGIPFDLKAPISEDKSLFEGNLIDPDELINGYDISINENSWKKSHRRILFKNPEAISEWVTYASDEEINYFMKTLELQELVEKNIGQAIMILKPITKDSRVRKFIIENVKMSPEYQKKFNIVSGLSDIGF